MAVSSFRSGMPESSAMDGNVSVAQMLDSVDLSACSLTNLGFMVLSWPQVCLPWTLDSGIPDRNDGFPILVYNDERSGVGVQTRRTGFVIPSVTFCATAGFWPVDITFGSGLQIPTRARLARRGYGKARLVFVSCVRPLAVYHVLPRRRGPWAARIGHVEVVEVV